MSSQNLVTGFALALALNVVPVLAAGEVHPDQWPAQRPALPSDPALEQRVTNVLAGLSVEEKVGQLIQADIGSITVEQLRHYPLGSVLNGGNSGPGNNDLAPASEWLAAADRFYEASIDASHGRTPVPEIWGTDAVHGHNNIIGATIFPHNIGLGAAHDPALIRRIGEVTAVEVRVTGLDWTFGPTLAVVRDPRWGRTYESYSEDPQIVREYAAAMVEGLQGNPGTGHFLDSSHVIATPKHFLGDGGTGGRDQGDNRSSEGELRDIHGAGYPPAIAAGAQSVMASFSSWQGVKMHGNRGLLTDVLKGRMGLDGFVVGDWNGHSQVPGCTAFSCANAINAGIDMLMAPDSWQKLFDNTIQQVKSGEISAARLDDAVRRILRVKMRAHVFDEGRPSSRPLAGHFELLGSPEHRAVARQAVRESLVLLKNAGHLLPLNPHAHVLVAGDGADNIGKQSGGWTISWQGFAWQGPDPRNKEYFPHGESVYAGIEAAVHAAGGTAELSATGEFKTHPDVAIVVFGENPYAEFQGDVGTLEYSPGNKSDLQLLQRLKGQGIRVVSVFLSGRPMWVNPELNASDAFVAAFLPGTEGGGVADVLFNKNKADFHGKLSFSWPPAFPRGYGLVYASNGDLQPLSEDFDRSSSSSVDTHSFFAAGKPGSGWEWVAGAANPPVPGLRPIPGGVGMAANGALRLAATDHSAQEDSRRLTWGGGSALSIGLSIDNSGRAPIDLQRESNGQLSLAFDYRVDQAPTAPVVLAVQCGAGCRGTVPLMLTAAPVGQWRHAKVLLSCFARTGAHMDRVTTPFSLETAGKLELSVSNVHLESGTDGLIPCSIAAPEGAR